jgi:hypothetical protein
MTGLERLLTRIIALIDEARLAGDARTLAALARRKAILCAALAAPEQGWS